MKKTRKAFTLIEMVIVLFIISLLLLIMIPNLADQKTKADQRSDEAFRTTIKAQKELYSANALDKDGKVVEKDSKDVTIQDLLDGGYITKDQSNKAMKLEKSDKDKSVKSNA